MGGDGVSGALAAGAMLLPLLTFAQPWWERGAKGAIARRLATFALALGLSLLLSPSRWLAGTLLLGGWLWLVGAVWRALRALGAALATLAVLAAASVVLWGPFLFAWIEPLLRAGASATLAAWIARVNPIASMARLAGVDWFHCRILYEISPVGGYYYAQTDPLWFGGISCLFALAVELGVAGIGRRSRTLRRSTGSNAESGGRR